MSNYSTFFPTGSGGGSSTTGTYRNRRIFYGPGTCTWTVPSGTTSVQVHVWGGGGAATGAPDARQGGGGGGGYARAEYAVTDSDSLAITIGGPSGTSFIDIPTQTPVSRVEGGGGASSTSATGGAGGNGTVTLGSQHPTSYCFTASGGCGGDSHPAFITCANPPNNPNQTQKWIGTGGGGAAGSPQGNGGCGGLGFAQIGGGFSTGSGGGIGKCANGTRCEGGGSRGCRAAGKSGSNLQQTGGLQQATRMSCRDDIWWRVEDIGGAGGVAFAAFGCDNFSHMAMSGGSGSGGGGGGISFTQSPTITVYANFMASMGGQGGFLGGGGGNIYICQDQPTAPQTCFNYTYQACSNDGRGGYAGGAGGGAEGMPGVVIIYW